MFSKETGSFTGVSFDNSSYITDEEEGIHVSTLVKDKNLVGSIEGAKTLYDLFINSVHRKPNNQYLGWHDSPTEPYRWITYAETNKKVEACGSGLLHLAEVKPASVTCFGVYASNCIEWMITEIACWAYGLVVTPLYDTLGLQSLKYICNETEMPVVICDTPDRAKKLIGLKNEVPYLKCIVIVYPKNELENLRSLVGNDIELITFDELLTRGDAHYCQPAPLDSGDGLVLLCYTSGTTGIPKGAMIRNKNMIGIIAATNAYLGNLISEKDTIISFLPLAHIYEQYCEIYITYAAGRIGYYSGNIMTLSEDMQALHPTIFPAVPRLLCRLYDAICQRTAKSAFKQFLFNWALKSKCQDVDRQIYKFNGVWDALIFSKIRKKFGGRNRIILIAGAPIAPSVLRFARAVFSCPVLEGFGCTETCGPTAIGVGGDLNGSHVGAPVPCAEIKLCDLPEMNLVAKRDNKGEICIRGAACVTEYYKSPERTAELIDNEGWLHTGDVGTWHDGSLKVVDRFKHIFKLAQGEYVAPEKLEQIYQQSALVNQVFVDGDTLSSFPVALVFPEVDALEEALQALRKSVKITAEDASTPPPSPRESSLIERVCTDPEAKRLVFADLKRLGDEAKLAGFEKVMNIKLIMEPFTPENAMLTPSLKTARHFVRKHYAEDLANLYKENAVPS